MSNKNYLKGIRAERILVNKARSEGKIAFRSAGSHSPIDVTIIDTKKRQIRFIQCKSGHLSKKAKLAVLEALNGLSDEYTVDFSLEHQA